MSLTGSAFESGGGEINSTDMLQSGTSYVSHDLTGDNSTFGGSYAPVVKGVHQCGGGRKKKSRNARKSNRRNARKSNRRNARKSNRRNARKSNRRNRSKKNKTRKNKKHNKKNKRN